MPEENNINSNSSTNGYTLSDYYFIFRKHKRKIFSFAGAICLITIIINFFVLDLIYLSSATLKTSAPTSGLSGLLPEGIPDLEDLGGLAGGSSAKEIALYENILYSRKCIEETIIKFNLMDRYDYTTMYDAVKNFREEIMETDKDRTAGTFQVGVYDKDPAFAKEIVEFLIQQLNTINIEMKVQEAKNNRQYIQERYDLVRKDVRNIEDSMKTFQNIYGIAPDLQLQASTKVQFELEVEIKSEEIKLDLLRKILSPNEPEIKAQEEKISSLNNQLASIQNSEFNAGSLNIKGGPEVLVNYLRLKRDVEIQNKIMTTLIPLLEQAKIEENRKTPTLLILDPPNIPDRKVKPKRLTNVVIMTFLGFTLSFLLFVAIERFKPVFLEKKI